MVGYNILPIGFSTYEKSTIETFFRLAGRRAPHWGLTTRSNEARVVLFNATSEQDVDSFRTLVASWQKVIIVGASDFGTGWPVLPRPIKLTAILGLLDDIAKQEDILKTADVPQPAPVVIAAPEIVAAPLAQQPAESLSAEIAMPAVVSKVAALAASTPAASFEKPSMTDIFASITTKIEPSQAPKVIAPVAAKFEPFQSVSVPLNEAPSYVAIDNAIEQMAATNVTANHASTALIGRVLLVDDSDIALKYMQNRLRHFGYECELVRSGEEALAMVATHNYQFVFLDVMMAGLDGYQTCKAIKNNKARRGAAPVVVMLTSRGGTIDKIRGSMAGCDAYLTKPLNDKKLAAVLTKFDDTTITERWEAANPRQPLVDTYSPRSR
jgi:CheY-like chemotaxis protein